MANAPNCCLDNLVEKIYNRVNVSDIAVIHKRYGVQIIFPGAIGDNFSGTITLCPKTGKWLVYIKKDRSDVELVDFIQGMVRLALLANMKPSHCDGLPNADVLKQVAMKIVSTHHSLVYGLYLNTSRSYTD